MVMLSDSEDLVILAQYQRVTDRQIDGRTDGRTEMLWL